MAPDSMVSYGRSTEFADPARTVYAAPGAATAGSRGASGVHHAGQTTKPRKRSNVMFVAARPPTASGTGFPSDAWIWYADRAQRLQWPKHRINGATAVEQTGQRRPRRTARPPAEDAETTFLSQKGGWPERSDSARGRLVAWAHRHPASRKSLHAAYGCGQQNNGHWTAEQIFVETRLLGTASVRQFWNGCECMESRLIHRFCMRNTTERMLHGGFNRRSTRPSQKLNGLSWISASRGGPSRLQGRFFRGSQWPLHSTRRHRGSTPWWQIEHRFKQGLNRRADAQSDPPCQYLDSGKRR